MRVRPLYAVILAGLLWLILGTCATGAFDTAHAQPGGFITSGQKETTPAGLYQTMWNATGSQINAGTVVMIDTVAAANGQQIPLGKGFRTWDALAVSAATSNYWRVVGILTEDCPGYQPRKILVRGTYNLALMDATGITGLSRIRLSETTAGALAAFAVADSSNQQRAPVGIFQRYATASALTAQVWVDFTGLTRGR